MTPVLPNDSTPSLPQESLITPLVVARWILLGLLSSFAVIFSVAFRGMQAHAPIHWRLMDAIGFCGGSFLLFRACYVTRNAWPKLPGAVAILLFLYLVFPILLLELLGSILFLAALAQ